MNIVLLGTAHPYRGGLASFNERLTNEIAKTDAIKIYNFSLQYPNFLFPGVTQYSESPKPESIEILDKVNSISPINWIKIGLELKDLNLDLIIVKYWLPFMAPCLGTILKLAKSNKKTKVICIIDNIVPHESRWMDRVLTQYFVNTVDGFIAMSDLSLKQLKKFDSHSPRKLSPHPIFDNFGKKIEKAKAIENLGLDDRFNYFLFFGFIRDYKGLDLLLEAFGNIRKNIPNTKLIVAGEFYTKNDLYMALIEKYNMEEQLIMHTHFIEDKDVANYFSASDLLILPYKSATQSGVTQIGFHYEIPMMVTSVGGLPEMIEHGRNGILVEPTADSIAKGIAEFVEIENKNLFVEELKKDKQKYSWTQMKNDIYEIYNQITK